MIELSLTEYCITIIVAAFIMVAFFGWISRFAHRNAERRGVRRRFRCDLCMTVWEVEEKSQTSDCPHCGKLCQKQHAME